MIRGIFLHAGVVAEVDAVNALLPATVRATMYPTGQAVGERRATQPCCNLSMAMPCPYKVYIPVLLVS